jgi:anhydro-N-acetylmuramic acid kinase
MKGIKRLADLVHKPKLLVIGLMSGMSADGVDLALTSIEGSYPNLKIQLLGSHYRPYPKDLKEKILASQDGRTADVSKLNFVVAKETSLCVREFLHKKNLSADEVDLIGSHGQTLFHSTSEDEAVPSSLQVGSPSLIAELTGISTVGNFRVRDIIAGGQGAPLVCMADYILFRRTDGVVFLNNLGSISNVTVVTENIDDMLAFDTGPANMAIDFFSRLVLGNGEGIDKGGQYSAQGSVVPSLLQDLMDSKFFDRKPPKSAGYQEFGPVRLAALAEKYKSQKIEDLIRTSVEFTALTLSQAYREFVLPKFPDPKKILFSGGGVHNQTLMKRIRELLPELSIEVFEDEFADAKEAICFAILAHQTLFGGSGNVISVTGANKAVVLGEVAC